MKILLICLILICSSSFALGETYKWEDENGIHITDNASSIPEKYRNESLKEARQNNPSKNTPTRNQVVPNNLQPNSDIKPLQQPSIKLPQVPIYPPDQAQKMANKDVIWGPLSSVVNQGLSIIIRGVLMLVITEILFLVFARFIATKNKWNIRRTMTLAQLVWLPIAYFIAIQMLTNIAHINDARIKSQTSQKAIIPP